MQDPTTAPEPDTNFLRLTTQIVSAHISANPVAVDDLPELIQAVYRSLTTAGIPEAEPTALTPAVPIRKSVFPDYIVCLEDGRKLKTMKRHLHTSYGMTPAQYRQKWGLPSNYPMVAPNYAIKRSGLAQRFGLGRSRASHEPFDPIDRGEEPLVSDGPPVTIGRARRARGSKG